MAGRSGPWTSVEIEAARDRAGIRLGVGYAHGTKLKLVAPRVVRIFPEQFFVGKA